MLAPALGFNHFENGRCVGEPGDFYGKAKSVYATIKDDPHRPLVWIDDDVVCIIKITSRNDRDPEGNIGEFFQVRPLTLLMEGLTLENLNVIDEFLRNPTKTKANNFEGLTYA